LKVENAPLLKPKSNSMKKEKPVKEKGELHCGEEKRLERALSQNFFSVYLI
jgi:hypothetical protein